MDYLMKSLIIFFKHANKLLKCEYMLIFFVNYDIFLISF